MINFQKLLEDLSEIEDETERVGANEKGAKREKIENEKCQALEMREKAMERFGQTRKRVRGGNVEGEDQIRKRRRSSEMLEWLKGRTELETF